MIDAPAIGTFGVNSKVPDSGLEPGYAEDKWGPWKSHKLLLNDATSADSSWSSRSAVLSRTFTAFSRVRPGFLSEKEFGEILNSFVCCEEVFYHHFFQLFDRDQDGFLTEVDFISGMLAVSPISEHDITTPGGQLRMQLIFLYYDANRNGRLDVEELSLMIEHLEQLRSERTDRGPKLETRQMAVSDAKGLMALYRGGFWYRSLFDACSKGMLTGLDQLLRTNGDLATAVLRINPQLAGMSQQAPIFQDQPPIPLRQEQPPLPLRQEQPIHYRQEQVQEGPQVIAQQPIAAPVISRPISVPSYPPPQPPAVGASMLSASNQSMGSHFALSTSVTHSSGSSGPVPLPLRIVRGLMDYTATASIDWRGINVATAGEILQLCDSISVILKDEDSLVSVPFPARLYGDIHGNLPDLVQFFNRYSWPDKRKGDILSMNYVFNGDFVDRGCFSVEVVALLFSLKLLYPTKIYLVRGNHEDRNMNMHYGFRKSCHLLYGPTEGQLVWERVNECFDLLPLAALVGEEVLCIHGGIGESIESVGDLMGIQKPIIVPPDNVDAKELSKVDKVVLDALWSDPYDETVTSSASSHLSPRGNGANRFSADRVKSFCAKNNLQLIVRAHECVQNGYEYFADGMLLTVFSASSYCNQYQNDGGMVVVVRNQDGSMEEHAQVIKTNADTRIGWEDSQYRQPSPMRGVYTSSRPQLSLGGIAQSKVRMPFIPVTYPASPGSGRLF